MHYLIVAFTSTFLLLLLLLNTRLIRIALDKPNHRSLHTIAIPRTGGIAIMAGILVPWYLIGQDHIWLLAILLLTAVSLIDDIRGLSITWRLLAQLIACIFLLLFGPFSFEWQLQLLLALMLVWIINLYNFMDGADGLAGGMTLFGFGFYGFAAYLAGDMNFAVMNGCIAVSALAFLLFNFAPARIFMGDAGSMPLGFIAGSMGLYGWKNELWPAWFPVLLFSPFIVDATVTLLKRLARGEKVWQAHKEHYYQRLIQLGWRHRKTAFVQYCVMIAAGMTAILLLGQDSFSKMTVFIAWTIFYLIVMRLVDKNWSLRKS